MVPSGRHLARPSSAQPHAHNQELASKRGAFHRGGGPGPGLNASESFAVLWRGGGGGGPGSEMTM